MKLFVCEIFKSIMGESSYSGLPFVFVRLHGCNIRCSYCDTKYAYEEEPQEMSIDEICEKVISYNTKYVEITGGEPLLQENMPLLADKLVEAGKTVLVETNGTTDISLLKAPVVRVMDIKCPGSGMSDKTDWNNIDRLRLEDDVKFVVSDRNDFDWSISQIKKYNLQNKCNLLFSPVTEKVTLSEIADWLLKSNVDARLQFQLHRLIWPEAERGF